LAKQARAYRLVGLVLLAIGFAVVLYRTREVLTPFLIGAAIAYTLNPLVDSLERRGAPRVAGIVIVYAFVLLVLALILVYLIPATTRQLERMSEDFPARVRSLELFVTNLYEKYHTAPFPETVREPLDSIIKQWEALLASAVSRTISATVGLLHQLPNLVLAPVLAFYFSRDKDEICRKVMSWVPAKNREEISNLIGEIDAVVGGFVRGQLLVAAIMVGLLSVGLWLTGIEFWFPIGVAAGILDVIPYFGPILGAIPAVIIALLESPLRAVYVVIVFVVANQIESAVLTPRIVSGYVGLHPLTVIFALLVGAYMLGLWGMIIAVPVAGMVKVVARYAWLKLVTQ
jgi:predicted PurR-regulated permease PerM